MKDSSPPAKRRRYDAAFRAERGAELDPAAAAELRQLRALARRQSQELEILKKAIAIFSQTPNQ